MTKPKMKKKNEKKKKLRKYPFPQKGTYKRIKKKIKEK